MKLNPGFDDKAMGEKPRPVYYFPYTTKVERFCLTKA